MIPSVPRITIEQVFAFTALADLGSFRAAAGSLCLSEEGLRSRVLALEDHLGTALYQKERGRRGDVQLTAAGRAFLDRANRFLDEARALANQFDQTEPSRPVKLAVSHCAACLLTADVLRDLHAKCQGRPMQVVMRTEARAVATLRDDADFCAGICTLDEPADDLVHHQWTSMDWRLIAPPDHPLLRQPSVALRDIANEPLIAFEPNSAPRQHVMEAFHALGLTPRVAMEVTSTQAAVRLVEAGLGLAIVPVPAWGDLMDGARLGEAALSDPIRRIDIAILTRPAAQDDAMVRLLVSALLAYAPTWSSDGDTGVIELSSKVANRRERPPAAAAA